MKDYVVERVCAHSRPCEYECNIGNKIMATTSKKTISDLHFDHFNYSSSRFFLALSLFSLSDSPFLRGTRAFAFDVSFIIHKRWRDNFFSSLCCFCGSARWIKCTKSINMNVVTRTFWLIENDKHKSCMKNYVKSLLSREGPIVRWDSFFLLVAHTQSDRAMMFAKYSRRANVHAIYSCDHQSSGQLFQNAKCERHGKCWNHCHTRFHFTPFTGFKFTFFTMWFSSFQWKWVFQPNKLKW